MIVKVSLSSGSTHEIKIEDYNASEIVELINDSKTQVVSLGNIIVQKFNILEIVPINIETEEK